MSTAEDNAARPKVVLSGGAGLVGQNLIARLRQSRYTDLVVLDKHRTNLEILRRLHPEVTAECVDLADAGPWERHFASAAAVVILHAQIGDLHAEPFIRNNVTATERVLEVTHRYSVPFVVHVSSSVVQSSANDHYTNTKRTQEKMVAASGLPAVILRPTLMFGWFDRKHLGWLARFMRRTPVFPIPGDGRYMRQPLYVGDFCGIIARCIEMRCAGGTYNISGLEKIDYIEMIREIRRASGAGTPLVRLPVGLFQALLRLWAVFDRNPPFTADQLRALIAHDEFEVIDWPKIFGVPATPFAAAIEQTLNHPTYGRIVLDF